jgi:hypothetical protein
VPAPSWNVGFRDAVRGSADLERILALPRRAPLDLKSPRAQALVELMTARLRRPDRPPGAACACRTDLKRHRCVDRLLPLQAWSLWEAGLVGGLLGFLPVGSGKTLLDIMFPMVIDGCKVSALFVPPGLVEQLIAEYRAIAEHFVVPSLVVPTGYSSSGYIYPGRPALHIVPYSKFSRPEATELLDKLAPDTKQADECHKLKNRGAVSTGRFIRSYGARPQTRLGAWTGSPIKDSIKNIAHLSAFALGESSPLPLDPDVVEQWASHLDPSDWPAPAGALKRLLGSGETDVSVAVQRRIAETLGVITAKGSVAPATILLRERKPPAIPRDLAEMIKDVRASWTRPDGEEFVEAIEIAACVKQLACGFYYRWRFPDRPAEAQVLEWFAARKAWHKELREKLRHPQPHLDSPFLLAKAAIRYYAGQSSETHIEQTYVGEDELGRPVYESVEVTREAPVWASQAWPRWRDVRDSIRHETEAVWVSDYLVRDAAEWATKNRGIVWYDHDAFGRAVAEAASIPLHGGGAGAEARILAEKGDHSICASIRSHGTGRNGLQFLFNEQLVANPPSSGDAWEQLLGRLNREGQRNDEVVTFVYRHTVELRDAIDKAIALAKYIEGITSNTQMLLSADVEWGVTVDTADD